MHGSAARTECQLLGDCFGRTGCQLLESDWGCDCHWPVAAGVSGESQLLFRTTRKEVAVGWVSISFPK